MDRDLVGDTESLTICRGKLVEGVVEGTGRLARTRLEVRDVPEGADLRVQDLDRDAIEVHVRQAFPRISVTGPLEDSIRSDVRVVVLPLHPHAGLIGRCRTARHALGEGRDGLVIALVERRGQMCPDLVMGDGHVAIGRDEELVARRAFTGVQKLSSLLLHSMQLLSLCRSPGLRIMAGPA